MECKLGALPWEYNLWPISPLMVISKVIRGSYCHQFITPNNIKRKHFSPEARVYSFSVSFALPVCSAFLHCEKHGSMFSALPAFTISSSFVCPRSYAFNTFSLDYSVHFGSLCVLYMLKVGWYCFLIFILYCSISTARFKKSDSQQKMIAYTWKCVTYGHFHCSQLCWL